MVDITISNGDDEEIIGRSDALEAADPTTDWSRFIIYVDGDVKIAHEDERESARHGMPVKGGTHVYGFNPKGAAIYAHNDEDTGPVTVSVTRQKYDFGVMG